MTMFNDVRAQPGEKSDESVSGFEDSEKAEFSPDILPITVRRAIVSFACCEGDADLPRILMAPEQSSDRYNWPA